MVSSMGSLFHQSVSRRRVLRGAAVGGTGLAAAALIGCGGDEAPASAPASTAGSPGGASSAVPGTPQAGGTIVLSASEEPTIWDPVLSEASPPAFYAAPLFPHLFVTKITAETGGNSFDFESDLVDSWEQPDDTTYIFRIRENATWGSHPSLNGRAITAEDVAYSLERLRSEVSVIRGNFEPVDTIVASDTTTVEVTLRHPFGPFVPYLSDTSAIIAPPEVEESLASQETASQVGGGPWLLDRYDAGVRVEYVRNPEHYLAPVPYAGLQFIVFPDDTAASTAFESGQLHAHNVSAIAVKRLRESHAEIQHGTSGAAHQSIFFDTTRAPWDDDRVRRALRLAIDFDQYRSVVYPEEPTVLETPARGWFEPYALPQEELAQLYTRNLEEAHQLLDAAGFGGGLDGGTFYAYPGGGIRVEQAQPVLDQWNSELGVRFALDQLEYSAHQQLFKDGNYNVGIFIYSRRYPDPDQYVYPRLHSSGALNYSRGSDARLDELLVQQREQQVQEERVETLHELQRYFIEDLNWMIVLPTNQVNRLWWPKLRDYTEHVSFGQYGFRRAWLEG